MRSSQPFNCSSDPTPSPGTMVLIGEGAATSRTKASDDYSSTQSPEGFPPWSNVPVRSHTYMISFCAINKLTWRVVQSMFMDPIRIPFTHYALVYIDPTGQVRFDASESIRRSGQNIFTPELRQRFVEAASVKSLSRNSLFVGL